VESAHEKTYQHTHPKNANKMSAHIITGDKITAKLQLGKPTTIVPPSSPDKIW